MRYLANGFSPSMISSNDAVLLIKRIDSEQFCEEVKAGNIINAIGHEATVQFINELCGTTFTKNRIEIKLKENDQLFIVSLTKRIEEGKVLSKEEMKQITAFYYAQVM
ncbi:STIV orfB116 family protein [Acidianus manzaensis]|uniref:DUF1874 domain-containing protein n=1 Tax=Acidianus manzaensis TaxID=282676 RepID=A0A1W6K1S7_9CREN|nr:DUF1874 domain-containing protein [Acidianus manzaensis]ARM76422.1 hypothetical protein B6F84_10600 [Acidianus manzaensis]